MIRINTSQYRIIRNWFASVVVLFALAIPAISADYYISTQGDDTNPGTLSEPFRTIQMGANTAQAGDNVYILQGTYTENIIVSNSGSDYDHMISFYTYGNDEVIVDAVIGLGFHVQPGADYIRIEGLTIINGHEGSYNGAGIRAEGNYGIYNHNTFYNNKHGVYLSGWYDSMAQQGVNSHHNEVAYNLAFDNEASGVWMKHSDYAKVHHNVIYHNTTLWDKGAITFYCGQGDEIYNNTVYDNVQVGIWNYNGNQPFPSPYTKVMNNLVVVPGPSSVAFRVDEMMTSDPTVEYHHNLWYSLIGVPLFDWGYNEFLMGGQTLNYPDFIQLAVQVNPINGYGDILQNPQLVDPNNQNYNLLWGSPAIDAGPVDAIEYDPDGTRPDIGVIFFNQSGSGEIEVSVIPLNPPIVIPSVGGSFSYEVTLQNTTNQTMTFDAWVDVTLPVGGHFGPLVTPRNLTLPSGGIQTRILTQNVPPSAQEGEYTLNVYAGNFPPTEFFGSDRFTFEKIGMISDGESALSWKSFEDTGTRYQIVSAEVIPDSPELLGAFPNPFNPKTAFSYKLQASSFVNLAVYDVAGRQVAELVNGWREAGSHEVTFDGTGLASGVYVYRLQAGEFTGYGKMILLK